MWVRPPERVAPKRYLIFSINDSLPFKKISLKGKVFLPFRLSPDLVVPLRAGVGKIYGQVARLLKSGSITPLRI